jgi:chromosome segregation ATPase
VGEICHGTIHIAQLALGPLGEPFLPVTELYMKRLILGTFIAALAPTWAIAQSSAGAKPAAKPPAKAAAAAPAAKKAAPKRLTRAELRNCVVMDQQLVADTTALEQEGGRLAAVEAELNALSAKFTQAGNEIAASETALKADMDALSKEAEAYKANAAKMTAADSKAQAAALNQKTDALNQRAERLNQAKSSLEAELKAASGRVDSYNQAVAALAPRVTAQKDAADKVAASCGDRTYRDSDLARVTKELAKQASAPSTSVKK